MKKYGLFIGRFQPFHLGHQMAINEILLDGRIPIIVYGSSNSTRDTNKNPLTDMQRKILVESVYSGLHFVHVSASDYSDWDLWYSQLINDINEEFTRSSYFKDPTKPLQDDVILYYNNKEIDRCTFECFGKTYENTWYTEIFKDKGFDTKVVAFNDHPDLQIDVHATHIRANLEENRHLLDARVYFKLKHWGWK